MFLVLNYRYCVSDELEKCQNQLNFTLILLFEQLVQENE